MNNQINLFLGLFDELENDIQNFKNIQQILSSYVNHVDPEYRELYTAFAKFFELKVDKHEQKIRHLQSIVDNQCVDVKYTDLELDAMCLSAELQETKLKLDSLQTNYNILNQMYTDSVNTSLHLAREIDSLGEQIKQERDYNNN